MHAYVVTCQRALRAYVLACQRALRAYVLQLQRASFDITIFSLQPLLLKLYTLLVKSRTVFPQ